MIVLHNSFSAFFYSLLIEVYSLFHRPVKETYLMVVLVSNFSPTIITKNTTFITQLYYNAFVFYSTLIQHKLPSPVLSLCSQQESSMSRDTMRRSISGLTIEAWENKRDSSCYELWVSLNS